MDAALIEPTIDEVNRIAQEIVSAFSHTDTDAYFSYFTEDATFIFHPEARRFDNRAEYERTWASWIEEGWSVSECRSSDSLVQTFPGGAVFSHTVDTTVSTEDGMESYRERESIVFRMTDSRQLIAIHEHLSTVPEESAAPEESNVPGDVTA